MADFKQCEFFVVRYMPNAIRQEFVNIGVVLLEDGGGGFSGVRFTRDWRRARCADPDVDIELLESYEEELQRLLNSRTVETINYRAPMSRREWLLSQMQDCFSGALQLSPVVAILTESPEMELGKLAQAYVESAVRGRRVQSGRHAIYVALRDAFEKAGLWSSPLLRENIAVADYADDSNLLKDDPLKIDCGYRPNGVLHLFHALSLRSDAVDSAKALAFSYAALREAINAREAAETDLTVITEDGLNYSDRAVGFALKLLAHEGTIQTATVASLGDFAERARVELHL